MIGEVVSQILVEIREVRYQQSFSSNQGLFWMLKHWALKTPPPEVKDIEEKRQKPEA